MPLSLKPGLFQSNIFFYLFPFFLCFGYKLPQGHHRLGFKSPAYGSLLRCYVLIVKNNPKLTASIFVIRLTPQASFPIYLSEPYIAAVKYRSVHAYMQIPALILPLNCTAKTGSDAACHDTLRGYLTRNFICFRYSCKTFQHT